jgi:AcrR family transcriptional regulator
MTDQDLKPIIKRIAVENFNRNGYHGTTIRTIASEADCSIPMVYYYFKSKKDLFHEIIKNDYFAILKREAARLDTKDIVDFYTRFILNIMNLSEYEKKIYRLGIKVYLSFDGDEELLALMEAWEASIIPRHYQLIFPHLKDPSKAETIVRTLMHLLENLIESIVVKNRTMTEKEIREELSIVLG